MAKALECTRSLVVNKSADEVWEWLTDLRNVMATNQFHMSVDVDEAVARNPRTGTEAPILHEMMDRRFYRIARVTRCEDYHIAWGERIPDDVTYEDAFPHSEGWKVEALERDQCRITNYLRGRFRLPLGELIGPIVWDITTPTILDNDLQDVAFAIGAIPEKREIPMPSASAVLYRLLTVRELDGMPVRDFVANCSLLLKEARLKDEEHAPAAD